MQALSSVIGPLSAALMIQKHTLAPTLHCMNARMGAL